MLIDFAHQGALTKYRILSNTITPRPIAWISTISQSGTLNLAPFSFFSVVSSNPVVFSLCIGTKSNGEQKDTLRNLLETSKATINLVMVDLLPLLESSSQELPYERSEASVFDIGLQAVHPQYPPIAKGVKVAYFCDLLETKSFGGSDISVFLEAKECFIDNVIYREDLRFLPPHLGRVGKYYLQASELIDPKKP